MAVAFLVSGFLLAIAGLALVSVPVACVVGGIVLFVAGGLELRARGQVPAKKGRS